MNAAERTCTACISTTVLRNISWMSSTHTPTWSLMLTLISCLRRTILLKPDSILSAVMSDPEKDAEVRLVAESVDNFYTSYPDERVAVLVPWNKDADQISRELTAHNIPHFKISGTDLFTTRQAHLQVVYMESNMMAWSKILTGTGIYHDDSEAHRFVKHLRDNYLLPSDFLNYTHSSYMLELYRCCQGEYVIFDT